MIANQATSRRELLQFHALPQEIALFISEAATQELLNLALYDESARCFLGISLMDPDLKRAILCANTIVLSPDAIDCASTNIQALHQRNPNLFVVRLGRLKEDSLGESSISTTASCSDTAKMWHRMLSRMRRSTVSGGTAENPLSGARAVVKSHRFSKGACDAHRAGIRLDPVAGNNILHPPPVAE